MVHKAAARTKAKEAAGNHLLALSRLLARAPGEQGSEDREHDERFCDVQPEPHRRDEKVADGPKRPAAAAAACYAAGLRCWFGDGTAATNAAGGGRGERRALLLRPIAAAPAFSAEEEEGAPARVLLPIPRVCARLAGGRRVSWLVDAERRSSVRRRRPDAVARRKDAAAGGELLLLLREVLLVARELPLQVRGRRLARRLWRRRRGARSIALAQFPIFVEAAAAGGGAVVVAGN